MVRSCALLIALTGFAGGCLDSLGHEEDVAEHPNTEGISRLEDDRIEDKMPAFDPDRVVTESFAGAYGATCSVSLNKSATVTKLDIVPFEDDEAAFGGTLYRGRPEALAAVARASGTDTIPSMEVVNGALKPFNDGLYAAVELDAEADKEALLAGLLARLTSALSTADASTRPAFEDAAVLVGAATILGGGTPALDSSLAARASSAAASFEAEPAFARPIGFYTWTPALGRIFTRDRFLQKGDGGASAGDLAALAYLLGQDAALLAAYQRVTALYAGLTNPFTSYPLDALIPYVPTAAALADPKGVLAAFQQANPPRSTCGGTLIAFLPASRSKEVDYFDAQYCDGLPAGTNLLDALVDGIRSGAVDLSTDATSGWYDYQEYALETLLLPERGPESQHLLLTAGYKRKLVETFKSILIQTRETHVKQLAVATSGGVSGEIPPVDVYPLLPAEPFPTYYLRTARGYRFLRAFLEAARGTPLLSSESRLLESGDRTTAVLGDELDARINLLYGLAFLTADAVGMAREEGLLADELLEIDAAAAVTAARSWLAGWRTDPDVVRDPRVIVPILYGDGTTTYWAVVGVKALVARAEFVAGHEPELTASCWSGNLVPHRYTLLVEETAEIRLPSTRPPPTRDELRAICDANATKNAIVSALGAL